jgi:hypothetical protein
MVVSDAGRSQSLDEIHELVHIAIVQRRPIAAV